LSHSPPLPNIGRRAAALLALVALAAVPVVAQRGGGYAAASLRAPVFAQEIALGGLHVPFAPDASALFSNSSALGWLERPTVSATWSSPLFGVLSSGALGVAIPIGRFAAVGVGLSTMSSGEQAGYNERRERVGSFVDRELGFIAGGSLAIGPGSVGATIRMLRRDVSGREISNTGYAVDLGGTLAFIDRLYVGAVIANIAGEMVAGESTLRERIPWEARLNATYVHPLEERSESSRLDPSGTPITRRIRPRSYLLGTTGARMAQTDSMPTLGVAIEAVPVSGLDLGFRLGLNSGGEISGGFLYRLPVEFTDELRVDYAIRWYAGPSDVTHHVGITAGF
jgi:hypothetical protein